MLTTNIGWQLNYDGAQLHISPDAGVVSQFWPAGDWNNDTLPGNRFIYLFYFIYLFIFHFDMAHWNFKSAH